MRCVYILHTWQQLTTIWNITFHYHFYIYLSFDHAHLSRISHMLYISTDSSKSNTQWVYSWYYHALFWSYIKISSLSYIWIFVYARIVSLPNLKSVPESRVCFLIRAFLPVVFNKTFCIFIQLRLIRLTKYFAISIDATTDGTKQNAMTAQGKLVKEQQHLG